MLRRKVIFGAFGLGAVEPVSIPTEDGGVVLADVYGKGRRGVVLAHGGRFKKESWAKQAHRLATEGYRVVAIDFRSKGDQLHLDVLAAARYLRKNGARSVYVVGGSMGGSAGADAMIVGGIDRLVGLGVVAGNLPPEGMKGRKLFITTREDRSGSGLRLPGMLAEYARIPEPKEMIILEGSAHAQFMFETELGERVMAEIVRFLGAR